jgi:hypothetical protein
MFKERSTLDELMDAPDFSAQQAEDSFSFIGLVNRWLGGQRVVRQFIQQQLPHAPGSLRILDMGSGSCDIPIAIANWARKKGHDIHLTCIENNQHAADIARRNLTATPEGTIHLLEQDIFNHQPDQPYDCAIASMFFHHLDDERIQALLRHLAKIIKGPLLINDLRRCPAHYWGCRLLVLGSRPVVSHDALLSIRRGFTPAELSAHFRKIDGASADVKKIWLFRLAGSIDFNQGTTPS